MKNQMIIAVGGMKGGIGKTTLAIFLAIHYATQKKRVCYVDSDPKSRTAYNWHRVAAQQDTPLPFPIEVWPHAEVGSMVLDRLAGYDVILIDIGGDGDNILASAVEAATHVILVCTPKGADMQHLANSFQTIGQAAKQHGTDPDVNVAFSMWDNRREIRNEHEREKVQKRLPVLKAKLSHRASVYADAYCQFPPIEHLDEISELAKEMEAA